MDHLTRLEQGIKQWNQWRLEHPSKACSLTGQDLSHGYFFEGNFQGVDLRGANLQRACLVGANFQHADLTGADLSGAYLDDANFYGANLANANFTKATLERADMRRANLSGTQLTEVDLRTVQLPDPTLEPYSNEVASLLALKPIAEQPPAGLNRATTASEPASQRRPTAGQTSLVHRIIEPIKARKRKTPKELADRQQSIRLSTMPHRSAKAAPGQKGAQPLRTSGQGLSKRALSKQASHRRRRIKQQYSPLQRAPQNPEQTENQKQWGRRQGDQRLAALLGHSIRKKQPWVPAIAAAGIAMAVGLPFAIPTIVNSQQQIAAQSVTTLALTKSLTGTGQIWAIATHTPSNGNPQVIAGEATGDIQIWDGQTGETLQTLTSRGKGKDKGIKAIAMSASGQWLISSSSEALNIWHPETGKLVHTLPTNSKTTGAVAITPDERTFISSDEAGNITAWDIVSGQQRYQVNSGRAVWDVAIAPDGQSFVGSSGRHIRQWDIATGSILQEFTGHTDTVRSVAISPDGTTLASGSWDRTIKLWNLATGDLQTTLSGHTDQIASLAISPDGSTLASSSSDRTLKLWDIPSRQLTKTLDQNADTVVAVAFSSNSLTHSQTLISGGSNQTVNIWQ